MSLSPKHTATVVHDPEVAPEAAEALAGVSPALPDVVPRTVSGSNRGIVRNGRARSKSRISGRIRKPRSSEPRAASVAPGEMVIGTLAGLNDSGAPLVHHPLVPSQELLLARSVVALDSSHVNREVAIAFEGGDRRKPIVLGVLWRPSETTEALASQSAPSGSATAASAHAPRIVFTAEREIVLECGEASITLTRAGKVLIRGTYLLSRSSGVNRIKGGAVHVN